MPNVHFADDDLTVELQEGERLMKACGEEGTSIMFSCRRGTCGTCITNIMKGAENLSPPEIGEQMTLQVMDAKPNQRLACQCKVNGDVTVASPWGKKLLSEQGWFSE